MPLLLDLEPSIHVINQRRRRVKGIRRKHAPIPYAVHDSLSAENKITYCHIFLRTSSFNPLLVTPQHQTHPNSTAQPCMKRKIVVYHSCHQPTQLQRNLSSTSAIPIASPQGPHCAHHIHQLSTSTTLTTSGGHHCTNEDATQDARSCCSRGSNISNFPPSNQPSPTLCVSTLSQTNPIPRDLHRIPDRSILPDLAHVRIQDR